MSTPTSCDLLIRNGYVITVDARRRVFSPGAVAVRGHTVAAVGPDREIVSSLHAAREIDAEGAVVHPGFFDAHNHIVGAGCRGIFAAGSHDPVSGVNYAEWKAGVTDDDEAAATTLSSLQLLHNGYTGFVEPGTVFAVDAVAAAAEAVGVRACFAGPYLWDTVEVLRHLGSLESPKLFARAPVDFDRCIQELGSQLHRNAIPDGTLHGIVGLYGLGTATDELVRRAKAVADEHGVVLHQHEAYQPASTRAETERLGHTRIVHLAKLGVLDAASTLAHVNTLSSEDVDHIVQSGCSVVWCPGPYLDLGLAGTVECRMPELIRRGVTVALGSDTARNAAMGDEALCAHLVAANAHQPLAPETILELQTINAARSAGLEQITGSLEVGKRADLVVAKPDLPDAYPAANPVHQLVLTCRAGHARMVLVNGEMVLEEGHSTRIDEREAFTKAQESIRGRIARLGLSPATPWPVIC